MTAILSFLRRNPVFYVLIAAITAGFVVAIGSYMWNACYETGFANKAGEAQLGCFEFWFNRYQTLLGAGAALFAGWLAWRGVMRQVGRADVQIELLRQQVISEAADRLTRYVSYVFSIYSRMNQAVSAQKQVILFIEEMTSQCATIIEQANYRNPGYDKELDEMRALSRGADHHLTLLNEAALSALEILEKGIMPQPIHNAAIAFFKRSQIQYENARRIKQIAIAKFEHSVLVYPPAHMEEVKGLLQAGDKHEYLSDAEERRIVATEFKRSITLRDKSVDAAEALIG